MENYSGYYGMTTQLSASLLQLLWNDHPECFSSVPEKQFNNCVHGITNLDVGIHITSFQNFQSAVTTYFNDTIQILSVQAYQLGKDQRTFISEKVSSWWWLFIITKVLIIYISKPDMCFLCTCINLSLSSHRSLHWSCNKNYHTSLRKKRRPCK